MNPEELEKLRGNMRLVVLDAMNTWQSHELSRILAALQPSQRSQWLAAAQQTFQRMRADYPKMAFPTLAPEVADLWMNEFQDAFDAVSSQMERIWGSTA